MAQYSAYAPYVNEMNIWARYVKINCVSSRDEISDRLYIRPNIEFIAIENFNFLTVRNAVKATIKLPKLLGKCTRRCDCDHIRCPSRLIGCFIQMLFPSKTKLNMPEIGILVPNNLGPISYSHGFWVIAFDAQYDYWFTGLEQATTNIKSFFTATYSQNEISMRSK
jgi:hypothetical protein